MQLLAEGLAESEQATDALARSMHEGQGALESATRLTGEDVADALESVDRTLPQVEQAAEAMDQTLTALDRLAIGVPYDADQPLGDSVGELREALEDLPGDLRGQAAQTERASEELAEAAERTQASAEALASLNEQLVEAADLIDDYAERTAEGQELLTQQRDALATTTRRAQWAVVLAGIAFALMQFVPLYIGGTLMRGGPVLHDRDGPPPGP
ncbi:hypothetical protein ER308_01340 [Egibacter rhizosphaerae]|uniref:Uncharacterized protein n=2 Tax=Egibacter rhizosphaerae TaxID=1670831 RepID=A0A411YAZ4_9ACTN|nr:hypothetical protein ER308_01340 [Egibacter rhizosphaerae]